MGPGALSSAAMGATDDPLLSPTFPLPFDRVDPAQVEPAVDTLIARARARVEDIASDTAAPTYDDTLGALGAATEPLETLATWVGHLESVATTEPLRAAHQAIQPKIAAFYSELPLHAGLYRRLQALADAKLAGLPPVRARHLRKTLDAFRRHGADLPEGDKARVRDLDVELAQVTTRFAQHLVDATAAYERVVEDESRLAGLPEIHRAAARQSAERKGLAGYRFTLDAPSYVPALTHLEDATLREELWRAYHARATDPEHDNRPLIAEILRLRREKAHLLGYPHFAALVLEDRMAKTAERARAFVDDLRARTLSAFEREREALQAFAGRPLQPWDLSFWAERMRRERLDFDQEALRPYFPAPRVLGGMFEVARRLYGVSLRERPEHPSWHEDVRVYAVHDRDVALLGLLHIDLFPRPTKRGGAWMNGLVTGCPPAHPHEVIMCANLAPPVGDGPALLSHDDVQTLFHEFGHALHHLLSTVEVRPLAGTNVAWDFVELPSQIMENWCWTRPALDLFARHHETGAPLPEDLFQRMVRARTFRAATATMRQLGFASVDLALHVDFDPTAGQDPLAFAHPILQAHTPAPLPTTDAMLAGFSHLFADPVAYAAGYYSYKWAEVLDADAFSRFEREGLFSPRVGDAFRNTILARGDSDDPDALYRAFMGRDPEIEPLLRRSGLA